MNHLANKINNAIRTGLSLSKENIYLHEPHFTGKENNYLNDCINSTFVSSVGKFVDKFENDLANYTGSKYVIAVVNGTSALHISLIVSGVKPQDEVIVPAISFVATANAVKYCGATPHFVDIEKKTLGMDPISLKEWLNKVSVIKNGLCINKKTNNIIRAIVPMHTFGHPCRIEEIKKIANEFSLILIEDAAESLGSFYKSKHTGTFGKLGTLSFNGNKIITTGGGGAILTNSKILAKKAKHLTTTAKVPHKWEYVHDLVGYNYRLPNLNAALGCAQLESLNKFINLKRKLTEVYKKVFEKFENIDLFLEPKNSFSNYWLQSIILNNKIKNQRNEILNDLNSLNIMCRPIWKPLHKLIPYKNCPRSSLPNVNELEKKIINLPSSSTII